VATAALLVAVTGVASVPSAERSALVTRAIDKLGGTKKLSDIATLSTTGKHKH